MTLLQLYNAVLTEINKEGAPNITLGDFNYLANKAYILYINKRYNIYDVNQLTSDDLRVLKVTSKLDVTKSSFYESDDDMLDFMDATYTVELPSDYFHILNCICIYKVKRNACLGNKYVKAPATRLTSDAWSEILTNYWNRPSYKRPYFFINNVNNFTSVPTNPYDENGGTDADGYEGTSKVIVQREVPKSISLRKTDGSISNFSNVERTGQVRYGNVSKVLMEIRYGDDVSNYELVKVLVDYLKVPQHLLLTQSQLDSTTDSSQMLEFPDYVCQEIVNELVAIILENSSDPRLLTNSVVSLSIGNPVQQLTAQPAQ